MLEYTNFEKGDIETIFKNNLDKYLFNKPSKYAFCRLSRVKESTQLSFFKELVDAFIILINDGKFDIFYKFENETLLEYICKIDNEIWYGSDFRMDLPKNELKSLAVYVDGKYVKLDVSQMFNPNKNGELNRNQFKIQKKFDYYILYGFFSDGAGTYITKWKIKDGKSERYKISNDDEDFEWQSTN